VSAVAASMEEKEGIKMIELIVFGIIVMGMSLALGFKIGRDYGQEEVWKLLKKKETK